MPAQRTNRVLLHEDRCVQGQLLLLINIVADIAQLLLDLADGLKVRRVIERVPAKKHELDQVPRDVTPSNIQSARQMRQREALVHRHNMGDTVTGIHDHAGQQACRGAAAGSVRCRTRVTVRAARRTRLVRRA